MAEPNHDLAGGAKVDHAIDRSVHAVGDATACWEQAHALWSDHEFHAAGRRVHATVR